MSADPWSRPTLSDLRRVLEIVDVLRASTVDVEPPFIAVAERQQATVRVRVRTAPPW